MFVFRCSHSRELCRMRIPSILTENEIMQTFSLENKPNDLEPHVKAGLTHLKFVNEPFIVETQEGPMVISPDTVDGWDEGYYIAYPADGSKPYSIAPAYVRQNYVAWINPQQ